MKDDLLRLAGIEDIAGFYRDRFYTGGVLEASYFDAIDRFDMKFARTMWIYDNVRRGSSLLDLGCGEGLLALLKRKDVYLAGIDLSPELVEMATRNGYDEARGRVFYRHLLENVRADAGVESATLAAYTPLGFLDTPPRRVAIEGYEPRRGEDLSFMWNSVGSDYFRTLHIPVMAGREFEDRDDETAAHVAIVNQTLAQRFWGGAPGAIGKRIQVGDGDWRTVVGVVADVK